MLFVILKTAIHFRLPQIYEEFRHSIQNADANKDLKWWSNNHGVGMAMNWPVFEVRKSDYGVFRFFLQIVFSSLLKSL